MHKKKKEKENVSKNYRIMGIKNRLQSHSVTAFIHILIFPQLPYLAEAELGEEVVIIYFPTRSASSLISALTLLCTLKPVYRQCNIFSTRSRLINCLRRRSKKTSRVKNRQSRESLKLEILWNRPCLSVPLSVTRKCR